MYYHQHLNPLDFFRLFRAGKITFAGYKRRKIYGTLKCKSGKRMRVANRVFFTSEQEALHAGYRPCARCMPTEYRVWKEEQKTG
jgi:methylphosphotriester-DNA--protein-cysteine methyltransferase